MVIKKMDFRTTLMVVILISIIPFLIMYFLLFDCESPACTSNASIKPSITSGEGFPSSSRNMSENDMNQWIDEGVKANIDRWIEENGLNKYGDPKDTVYMGGTPLFDETTGRRMDKYHYIIKKHPELLNKFKE